MSYSVYDQWPYKDNRGLLGRPTRPWWVSEDQDDQEGPSCSWATPGVTTQATTYEGDAGEASVSPGAGSAFGVARTKTHVLPSDVRFPSSGTRPSTLLVGTTHNSALSGTATLEENQEKLRSCPRSQWLRGQCSHGTVRWVMMPCKKRDCPVCGALGRYEIAQRIAYGIRMYWPCAWLVLTFKEDVTKKEAVRQLGRFVRWLRGEKRGGASMQYVATFEKTKAGRLHINLIAGPWVYVSLEALLKAWGARLSVELVKDVGSIGKEAAKAYSPEGLGGYLSKLEQCVSEDRRVSYSKHWPKLPDGRHRKGDIKWRPAINDEDIVLEGEILNGEWQEVRPGEWKSCWGEECDCFELEDLMSDGGSP